MEGKKMMRIIVVDDSATMRMLISLTIKKILGDVHITEAVNGKDALLKMADQTYDLVLTDMQMPEMDGAQLIKTIREELSKELPIVIITTKGEEKDREIGLARGASSYITKPVKVHELRETVARFLS